VGLEFESPAGHQNKKYHPNGVIFFIWRFAPEIRKTKSNLPGAGWWRRLDGAKQLFLP